MAKFSNQNKLCRCRICDKLTHSNIDGWMDAELCRKCYEAATMENEHLDGHHTDKPHPKCPDCKEEKKK